MSEIEFSEETRFNEGRFRIVSYVLVMLMMTCTSLTISNLIHYFFPDWQSGVIAALAFFVAFERLYTYPRFKRPAIFSSEWLVSLAAQWIAMMVIIRLAIGLSHGLDALRTDLSLLTRDFASHFASPEFSIALIITIIIWLLTGYIADMLAEMGYNQALILREVSALDPHYVPPRARLMSLIFSLGSFLIVLTALVRVNIRDLFQAVNLPVSIQLGALSGGGASTLIYFMLGLALLSQTQFISLHTSWRMQAVHISRRLAKYWGLYSLLFLALLVGIVSLLPTYYSLGLLSALGYALDIAISFLYFAAQLILSIIVFLLGLPFILFGGTPPVTGNLPTPPLLSVPPGGDTATSTGIPGWELFKSLISWVLLLGIIGLSLIHFLRRHAELVERLRGLPGGRWLISFLNWLNAFFGGARRKAAEVLQAGLSRLRVRAAHETASAKGGFLNLRRLDPRQRVYYFYLALVRRGNERGLHRMPSQTPYEYAATLETALPAVDEDIESLTGSFMEARYSRHNVPPEKANLVKATWERIRQALRNLKKH